MFFRLIKYMDVSILCGHRGEVEQNEAYAAGNGVRWPTSRHNRHPSTAVDVAPYPIDWQDEGRFYKMAALAFEIAIECDVKLLWGGNWVIRGKSELHDLPHFYIKEEQR